MHWERVRVTKRGLMTEREILMVIMREIQMEIRMG